MSLKTDKIALGKEISSSYTIDSSGNMNVDGSIFQFGVPFSGGGGGDNYYPTAFAWTGGTVSGPTGSLTGVGMSAVSYAALPSASASASGIVTTGTQTISGAKTFSSTITGDLSGTATNATNATTATNAGYATTAGTATNATNATTATNAGYATTAGSATTAGNASTATILQTARTINGVSFNGSANITVEPYISGDDTGDTACYLTFSQTSTAGYKRLYEDVNLVYNNTSNILTCGTFSGALSGNATTSTAAQTANASTLQYITSYDGATTMRILGSHNGINSNGNVYSTSSIYMNCSTDTLYATNFTATGVVTAGILKSSKGRLVAGYLYGFPTEDEIFTALSPTIPNVNDVMIMCGGMSEGSTDYVIGYAFRFSTTNIHIRGMRIATGVTGYVNILDGNTATHTSACSW